MQTSMIKTQAWRFLFICVVSAMPARLTQAQSLDLLRAQQIAFEHAVANASPSVVRIETVGGVAPVSQDTTPDMGNEPDNDTAPVRLRGVPVPDGPTTGLIYSRDGLILTSAFNFVHKPTLITVILPDSRRFVAKLLARDHIRRLAMLKIDANDLPTPQWRKRDSIQVGQWALVLGRSFSRPTAPDSRSNPTIHVGIISGLNRHSGLAIQSDARMSPANFGGPLVDIDGKVFGIAVPMGTGRDLISGVQWYDSGIGFAIPLDEVLTSAEALSQGSSIEQGWLGVALDPANADELRILKVPEHSPAAHAGLQVGDVIVAINSTRITSRHHLRQIMRPLAAGEKIQIRFRRNDQPQETALQLATADEIGS